MRSQGWIGKRAQGTCQAHKPLQSQRSASLAPTPTFTEGRIAVQKGFILNIITIPAEMAPPAEPYTSQDWGFWQDKTPAGWHFVR